MNTRFWTKVDKKGPDDCWPWTAGRGGQMRYGYFYPFSRPDRTHVTAHRMAYCLSSDIDIRTLPSTTVIRHDCDNPICCNPAHLQPGTQVDNMRDMAKRNRAAITNRQISDEDIREIRRRAASGELHRVIAQDYPVQRREIGRIANGDRWKKVT